MMRWLVTGATGMLGTDLIDILNADGASVTACSHSDLDITRRDDVQDAVAGHDVVVNLAAWTDVDGAEVAEDRAHEVNGTGVDHVATACARVGARMVQVSTDYVFDGTAQTPYAESARVQPLNAYGRTKRAGEVAVRTRCPDTGIILRTSWLYGMHGPNFVATMARLSREREAVSVVDDQQGQPTWTRDVAERIVDLVSKGIRGGIYHATNAGSTTWYGLAQAVFEELGLDPARVQPVSSDQFPRPAARPAYSVLGHDAWSRVGLPALQPWRAALHQAVPTVLPQPASRERAPSASRL